MTSRLGRWLRQVFSRRLGLALLCALLMIGVAIAINLVGIRAVGSIDGWVRWQQAHAAYFAAWRLMLYAALAGGWWRVRKRWYVRAPSAHARHQVLRAEVAAVIAIVLVEGLHALVPTPA